MIIAVGHEKGGCGKTTVATNLAVWLAHAGRDVLLVDADKQMSATHWATMREQDARVAVVRAVQLSGNIAATVRDLACRYQDLVIDCGGRDSIELRSALVIADFFLAPVRPSQLDLWSLSHLDELVEQARALNPTLLARALLSIAPTNARGKESALAVEAIRESAPQFELSRVALHNRKAFRDAVPGGWSVLEMDDPKAATELNALAEEIYGQIQSCAAAAV